MLNYRRLGNSGLKVSEYCLGVLPMGPLQANRPESEIIEIIEKAVEYGVTFFDTAEMYQTEATLGKALQGKREQVVIATKSQAATYDDMARAFEKSLRELGTDYIDLYLMHSARPPLAVFEVKQGAHQFLCEMKEQKVLRAVGISTHSMPVVKIAAERNDIDVVFPLINLTGRGIVDGNREEMLEGIRLASQNGKGIYAMKVFAGGNLLNEYDEALNWVRSITEIDACAIGVVTLKELEMNLKVFGVDRISDDALFVPASVKKLYIFPLVCVGCGTCIDTCPNTALSLQEGKAVVDPDLCVMCGYCSPHCPVMAIRLL